MKIPLLIAGIALGLAGASTASAEVQVVQFRSAALAKGATFAWAPEPAVGYGLPNPGIVNVQTAKRLATITEAVLSRRGYRHVAEAGSADLLVRYVVVMIPETSDGISGSDTCAAPLCDSMSDLSFNTSPHAHGVLLLDLIERQTSRLVWRASSENRITKADVSKQNLDRLLDEMTKSLPARPRK